MQAQGAEDSTGEHSDRECEKGLGSRLWAVNLSGKMSENLQPLLDKLTKAKFTGELRVCFEEGQPASAKLIHSLAYSELGRELPTIEEQARDKVAHD